MLFAAMHEPAVGTFRTWRDVWLESGMRTKADVGHDSGFVDSRPSISVSLLCRLAANTARG